MMRKYEVRNRLLRELQQRLNDWKRALSYTRSSEEIDVKLRLEQINGVWYLFAGTVPICRGARPTATIKVALERVTEDSLRRNGLVQLQPRSAKWLWRARIDVNRDEFQELYNDKTIAKRAKPADSCVELIDKLQKRLDEWKLASGSVETDITISALEINGITYILVGDWIPVSRGPSTWDAVRSALNRLTFDHLFSHGITALWYKTKH